MIIEEQNSVIFIRLLSLSSKNMNRQRTEIQRWYLHSCICTAILLMVTLNSELIYSAFVTRKDNRRKLWHFSGDHQTYGWGRSGFWLLQSEHFSWILRSFYTWRL